MESGCQSQIGRMWNVQPEQKGSMLMMDVKVMREF